MVSINNVCTTDSVVTFSSMELALYCIMKQYIFQTNVRVQSLKLNIPIIVLYAPQVVQKVVQKPVVRNNSLLFFLYRHI